MSAIPTETQFLRDPEAWVASPGCVCQSAGIGLVHDVEKTPMVYAAGAGGALPGLTPEETAILAAFLIGLATFLFLLLPILCCLCPGCWGYGKKKGMAARGGHGQGNLQRSESFWSAGTWGGAGAGGSKVDYENLYGVDMKLPRPLVANGVGTFDSKVQELEDGGWEGVDMSRDEIDAAVRASHGGGETFAQTGMVAYGDQGTSGIGNGSSNYQGNSGNANGSAVYSTVDRSRGGGDEIITEYTTTRRMDMHIAGMNPTEADEYYNRTYGQDPEMSKENFMKIYQTYKSGRDGTMDYN